MTWVNPGAEFRALVGDFKRSAWRWECQGVYHAPGEEEPFRQWQAGHPDYSFLDRWVDRVRSFRAAGKTFERVRMVTEPPTEYLRWMFDVTPYNLDAGEDIRWVSESQARDLAMPDYDFYLFDEQRVAILHFGEDGVAAAEVLTDEATVAEHLEHRDRVWSVAIPHGEYATARSP